jgi:flagellar motor component MotA
MEAILIYAETAEQSRVLKAFAQALNLSFRARKTGLAELEAQLLPGQKFVWDGFKEGLREAELGLAAADSLEDLLEAIEKEDENTTYAPIR